MENAPHSAMIDSGTTFAYLSKNQIAEVDKALQAACISGNLSCSDFRVKQNCYKFSSKDHHDMKTFYKTFPVFKFVAKNNVTIKWFPSDYLFKDGVNQYCIAIDPYGRGSSMIIGGSMMRQNMYIFDMEKNQVATVRSHCSEDPDMYVYDDELYLDPNKRINNPSVNKTITEPIPSPIPEPTPSPTPSPSPPASPSPGSITPKPTTTPPTSPGPSVDPNTTTDPNTPSPTDPEVRSDKTGVCVN
mmetsp:Transcript_10008/g.11382  ORF Transcript_10008/g.11382 Transcript_10008/m.11382 type:complete len:244 (+) Transcript_10008:771-1502(+)